jgi:hypothetical protein
MNFEPAVNFLVGTILVSVGIFLVAMFVLLLNNIFSKYWKPVRVFIPTDYPYQIQTTVQDKIEPKV